LSERVRRVYSTDAGVEIMPGALPRATARNRNGVPPSRFRKNFVKSLGSGKPSRRDISAEVASVWTSSRRASRRIRASRYCLAVEPVAARAARDSVRTL
jgi:hypothetical protein